MALCTLRRLMSLFEQTASEHLRNLEAGAISSVELTQGVSRPHSSGRWTRRRVSARRCRSCAASRPRRSTRKRAKRQAVGRLAGLPVAVKDILCERGQTTTCASRMLENFRPPYDATVIAKLQAADAVLIGRTNMDEFAMGGSTENSAFQTTRNPWDLERIARRLQRRLGGGVAAGMAPLADRHRHRRLDPPAGRPVRRRRPEADLRPREPLRPGGVRQQPRPDRPVRPVGRRRGAAAGSDRRPRSARFDVARRAGAARTRKPSTSRSQDLRIGWVREHFGAGLDAEVEAAVREALDVYESLGATVHEISLPHSKYAVATYYVIAPCEASSNLARYDGVHYGYRTDEKEMLAELAAERKQLEAAGDKAGLDNLDTALVRMYRRTRAEGFGPEVKRRIMLGTYALSAGYYDAYYLKALKVRRLIRQDFDRAFEQVDLIVGPVTRRAGVQDRRNGRRSAGDVPGRSLHRQREPGRHPRHLPPLRPSQSGPADRPATASARRWKKSACSAAPACTNKRPTGTSSGTRL